MKKILIASDHAGFTLKEIVKKFLHRKKYNVLDLGPYKSTKVDYPDYAHKLSKKINISRKFMGVLVCGSGTGIHQYDSHPAWFPGQCPEYYHFG